MSIVINRVIAKTATPFAALAWLGSIIIISFAGPFGTFEAKPIGLRLIYWGGLIATAIVLAVTIREIFRHFFPDASQRSEDISTASGLALVFGPMVFLINLALTGEFAPSGVGLLACILVVLLVSLTVAAVRYALCMPMPPNASTPDLPDISPRDRLLQRLDVPDGVRIRHVASDNHHVIVRTSDDQSYRVLLRLRDAIREIDHEAGFCIHRSHWVAIFAIDGLAQDDGRDMVRLTCGKHVPVGPKYRKNLEVSGVLAGGAARKRHGNGAFSRQNGQRPISHQTGQRGSAR